MFPFRFVLLSLLACALCACGSNLEMTTIDNNPLTPMPETHDPGDLVLMDSVKGFLKETGSPLYSEYEFSRMDLDDDGRRDALVLFKNPYGFWCGGHGCTMLVMKANDDSFTLVNSVQPIRTPLEISQQKTNGWNTMIARVSGRSGEPKDVALIFDGHSYPQDPSALPAFDTAMFGDRGVTVFP